MKISYTPLWKLLIEKNMKKIELQKITGFGSSTMTKLRNDETVTTDTLLKICTVFNCQISDIIECLEEVNE
ncbi:helix-turn-helix domain-containing protein [Gemella sp.]